MIARRIAVAIALSGGILASQAPEFAQQYRQRLGGALAELSAIVDDFRADADKAGVDVAGAARRLQQNADPLAQARGRAMLTTLARRDALAAQSERMQQSGPVGRVFAVAENFDLALARGAWAAFEPAVPVTAEALAIGAAGALFGYAGARLVAFPFRRRRLRQA